MVDFGKGKEVFLMPGLLPGARPIVHRYDIFLDKRGPESKAVPVQILMNVGGRPILAVRDPADPSPATLPPAQRQLEAANKNLQYVLLKDIRNGQMDIEAHNFVRREEEVFRITLEWLKKNRLAP
jgi:hypothetical protein